MEPVTNKSAGDIPAGPITKVTDDLTKLFLNNLEEEVDVMSASTVSKNWSEKMVQVQGQLLGTRMNKLLDVMIENATKHATLREELSALKGHLIFTSKNLIEIKSSFLTTECEICRILNKLDSWELYQLKKNLSSINLDEFSSSLLNKLLKFLPKYNDFLEVKIRIPDETERRIKSYSYIGATSTSADLFCRLIALEESINNQDKCLILKEVCKYCNFDEIDRAVIIFHEIKKLNHEGLPDDFFEDLAYNISYVMILRGNLSHALAAVSFCFKNKIKLQKQQDGTITDFFDKYFQPGWFSGKIDTKQFNQALKVAELHVPTFNKSQIIKECNNILIARGDFDKAREIANLMADGDEKQAMLETIRQDMLKTLRQERNKLSKMKTDLDNLLM